VALRDWQNALAARVAGVPLAPLPGAPAVAAWPAESAGLAITKKIQRSWRRYRLDVGAPLTLAVLAPHDPESFISDFWTAQPWPSSFFGTEAVAFVEYVRHAGSHLPHVSAVAGFERAMLLISQHQAFPLGGNGHAGGRLAAHPAADIVEFAEDPARVLAALLRGDNPPPPASAAHWLLLAPHLPNLCRRATHEEARLFTQYRHGRSEAVSSEVHGGAAATAGAHRDPAVRAVAYLCPMTKADVEAEAGLVAAGALISAESAIGSDETRNEAPQSCSRLPGPRSGLTP